MLKDYRCFFCSVRGFEKMIEGVDITAVDKLRFTREIARLYYESTDTASGPVFSRELYRLVREYTGIDDPYKAKKRESNDLILSMYDDLKRQVSDSDDPFRTALRLTLAGNIIDFAIKSEFNIHSAIDSALNSELTIDHSAQLAKAFSEARTVLYLGDNAGEIVFDRLFIETVNHHNLVFVVRGAPVINDATLEDAGYVGMTNVVTVISNEYDAPTTIPDKSGALFRKYFSEADLIISKGQGNLEGLLPLDDKRIFYLLMVKCNVVADYLGVVKDSFVVYNPALSPNEKADR